MNRAEMVKALEQFSRKVEVEEGQTKVTQLPDFKTVHIETIGEMGCAITLAEYLVDGKTVWAGYSSRSDTLYVSRTSRN